MSGLAAKVAERAVKKKLKSQVKSLSAESGNRRGKQSGPRRRSK